jgi:ABC-type phosphate/phosphonate transport system substrate-binding protein
MSARNILRLLSGLAILLAGLDPTAQAQQPAKFNVLRIGVGSSIMANVKPDQKQTARDTLKDFIKKETGFDNEIVNLKGYQEVVEQLAAHKIQLAVFEGYELAWAQPDHPRFKPLAIAVNEYPYHYAYIVVRKDSKATDFASLQGQSLTLPKVNQEHVRLFVEREAKLNGKDMKTFFAKVVGPDNVEDALDDVVDGVVQVAAVDLVPLQAYKRRKPGRFAQLRELMHSGPFPAPAVVYEQGTLDEATLKRFHDGLVNAKNKEQGKMLLELYKLTAFESVPKDFAKVLQDTLKNYPPPKKQ